MIAGELDMETIDKVLNTMDPVSRLVMSDALQEIEGETERVRAIRYQAQYAVDNEAPLEISIPINDKVGIEFVLIPPGEFLMGSPDDCPYASKDEKPQHRVRINNPFWMAKYPTTQEQYEALIGTNPSHFKDEPNSPKHPVECVNWNDSRAFCDALTRLLPKELKGRKVRLPLEAEWEYACRAGSTTLFPWGNSCNGTEANVDGRHPLPAGSPKGPYLGRTCVVGSYKPNNFGLYDMIGQVWEWCQDGYDSQAYAKRAAKGIYIVGREGENSRPFVVSVEALGSATRGAVVRTTATETMPTSATTSTSVSDPLSEGEQSLPFVCEDALGTTTRGTVARLTETGSLPTVATSTSASESLSEGEDSSPFVLSEEALGSATESSVVRPTVAGTVPNLQATSESVSAQSSEGEQRSPFIISREVHGSTGRFVDQQADSLSMRGSVVTTATTTSVSAQSSEGEESRPFETFVAATGTATPSTVDRPTATGALPNSATTTSVSDQSSEGEHRDPFVVSVEALGTNYLPHAEPLTETVTAADGSITTFSAHTSDSAQSSEGEDGSPFDVSGEDTGGTRLDSRVYQYENGVISWTTQSVLDSESSSEGEYGIPLEVSGDQLGMSTALTADQDTASRVILCTNIKGDSDQSSEGEDRIPLSIEFAEAADGSADRETTQEKEITKSQEQPMTQPDSGSLLEGEESSPFAALEGQHGTISQTNPDQRSDLGLEMDLDNSSASESLLEGEESRPFDVTGEVIGSTTCGTAVQESVDGAVHTTPTTTVVFESSSEGENGGNFDFFDEAPRANTPIIIILPADYDPLLHGDFRYLRGGSFGRYSDKCKSATRFVWFECNEPNDQKHCMFGFRVVIGM